MSHEFESGVFYREAAWHRLGTVVEEWPGSWDAARKLAGIEWEVREHPIAVTWGDTANIPVVAPIHGYRALVRDDKPLFIQTAANRVTMNDAALLAVQPSSYKVIRNEEFGEIIEYIIGKVGDDWAYETLISLSGGRNIVALLRARQPLEIGGDPSKTYNYLCFTSRHDGQGGLRGIPTSVRVVCRNTHHAAETGAKRDGVGFTIRHTSNWEERKEQAALAIQAAVRDGKAWEKLGRELVGRRLVKPQLDRMLLMLFKTDSSMTPRQVAGIERSRAAVRQILQSRTCEHISDTMWGFVQAVDEYADHIRPARSDETRTQRSLLRAEPIKTKAFALAMGSRG